MFTTFDQELRKFRLETICLDSLLLQVKGFNNMQRAKLGTSAHDIVIAALFFRWAFEEAYQYWTHPRGFAIVKDPIEQELTPDPLKYLEASIKALLFPIRSFQDNIYGIFLYLYGLSVGKNISMEKCLNTARSPVCKLINQKLLEYCKWFPEMRIIRNRVKSGNSFSFGFKNERFGVILNNLNGATSALEASLDQIISVDTFEKALRRSTEISDLALNYAQNRRSSME